MVKWIIPKGYDTFQILHYVIVQAYVRVYCITLVALSRIGNEQYTEEPFNIQNDI